MTRTGCVYTSTRQLNVVVLGILTTVFFKKRAMWKNTLFVHNITICKVENAVSNVENPVENVDKSIKNRD